MPLSLSSVERKTIQHVLAALPPAGAPAAAPDARILSALLSTYASPVEPSAPRLATKVPAPTSSLPAHEHRDALLRTIHDAPVALIRGATGCGKSTQVPKFLIMDAAESERAANIVVAQPRRLAAMALADRVSFELGERDVGGLCGFRIRGESRVSPRTALTFVTTGVMLRQLEDDPTLAGVTHLIVDEVHERNVDTDLLLLVLRRAVAAGTRAKIVLMSATVDAAPIGAYFAPVLGAGASLGTFDIPGRSFAVEEHHLEDAIAHTRYSVVGAEWRREKALPEGPSVGAATKAAAEAREAAEAAAAATATIAAANLAERAAKLANTAAATDASKAIGGVATEWMRGLGAAALAGALGASTAAALRSMELSVVNEELVEALVARHHAQHAGDGAVLVFLPGVAEIERLALRLEARADAAASLHVVRLHSQLAPAEQRAAFSHAPHASQTKVVLATDIAETSVTIDDVTLVIDGGLHRAPSIEPRSGIVHLRTARISLAAAKQRAGRAGRVRAGTCYHLFCKVEAAEGMAAAPTAEIRRVPLEATVLRLHALLASRAEPCDAAAALAGSLEPPDAAAVGRAVAALKTLGALSSSRARSTGEALTPLGSRLARLPTEPWLGKSLLCAQALGCVEEAALIVASHEWAHDAFGRSAESGAARRALDRTSCHLALVRAHGEWSAAADESERRRAAERLGVNGAVLRDVARAASRLAESVGAAAGGGLRRHGGGGGGGGGGASNAALAKACLLAGGGALITRTRGGGKRPTELLWRGGKRKTELVLRPHAATILGGGGSALAADQLCVSLRAMRFAAGLVALDVTLVTALAVCLFAPLPADRPAAAAGAGDADGTEAVSLDAGGVSVELERADAVMLTALRERLDAAIGGAADSAVLASLRRTMQVLLTPMDVPWAGLPEGWRCEQDEAGATLYRSTLDPAQLTRQKPTRTAAAVAASAAAAKGSLERANAEHAAKKREAEQEASRRREAEAGATSSEGAFEDVEAKAEAARRTAEAEAARQAAEAARRAAEAEELKRLTKARAAAAEAAEMSARRKEGASGSVRGGVAKLLAELELADKYAAAFAAAGYDDAALLEVAESIDEDREEGARALDAMIAAVGLRGGSAIKVRKRLLEGGGGGGGGKGGRGKGGRGAKDDRGEAGGGRGAKNGGTKEGGGGSTPRARGRGGKGGGPKG